MAETDKILMDEIERLKGIIAEQKRRVGVVDQLLRIPRFILDITSDEWGVVFLIFLIVAVVSLPTLWFIYGAVPTGKLYLKTDEYHRACVYREIDWGVDRTVLCAERESDINTIATMVQSARDMEDALAGGTVLKVRENADFLQTVMQPNEHNQSLEQPVK